jgi:CAAD domains of cyanobacterial aminoacyl-tRNA synthetase
MTDSLDQLDSLPETLDEHTTEMETTEIPANPLGMNSNISAPMTTTSPEVATFDSPDWLKQTADILAELPSYLGQVYQQNQGAVVTLGLFFGAFVILKLALAILFAVNGIPLLAPTLELIGIGYTVWFVSRYLLQASSRDELAGEISGLKSEILGNPEHN